MNEGSFQKRVEEWIEECFSREDIYNRDERVYRFLEESIELSQASGCTKEEAIALVEYVFSRPVGDIKNEVGGVVVTLSGLCSAVRVDMSSSAEAELTRNWERIQLIREKYNKSPIDSPLPE